MASQRGVNAAATIASLLALVNDRLAVVVFIDLKKNRECWPQTAVVGKFTSEGVGGGILEWTHDYMRARMACVQFQGQVLSVMVPENGPQGYGCP